MTDKPFHTTQSETLLSGIHFDKDFEPMRIRGKKKWIINEKSKKDLEESLKRGLTVSVASNGGNSVGFSNGVVG